MVDPVTQRLDTFADAAFAFAVTLMVVGAGNTSIDGDILANAVASIPSFAVGFAIIALFWHAHARWRQLRGDGDWRSVLLTLVLIFVVLIYVVPLRGMASSFTHYFGGSGSGFRGSLATLFVVYGLGFTAMSVLTALLYRDALRNPDLDEAGRRSALGQTWIWTILSATGAVSTVLSLIPGAAPLAPWVYATLPVTIGLFSARWRWTPA